MRILVKILKGIIKTVVALVLIVAIGLGLWNVIPQFMASKQIDDLDKYALSTDQLHIDDDVKIIGFGEATHGNVEFQELKLDVMIELVEKYDVRAFALEADFGGGMKVNEYIHGGEGTAADAILATAFNIYQTKQMEELIDWMREYNKTAPEGEDIYFYGFDMQNPQLSEEMIANPHTVPEENKDLLERAKVTVAMADEYYDTIDFDDYINANNFRDNCMAENVSWIQKYEEKRTHGRILIAGHNGHVAKKWSFYETMGSHLKKEYGDAYHVIGTDYYKSTVNINIVGPDNSRSNHFFCSADPMAKKAKKYDGCYYINFSDVETGDTYNIINNEMMQGSMGEGYSPIMSIMPSTHRVSFVPTEIYDSMIFVYDASPIEVLE